MLEAILLCLLNHFELLLVGAEHKDAGRLVPFGFLLGVGLQHPADEMEELGDVEGEVRVEGGFSCQLAFPVLPVAAHIPGRVAPVEVLPDVVRDVRDDQLRLGDVVGFEILEVLIVQFTFQFGFSP